MTILYHQVIWDHVYFSVTKQKKTTNNFWCMDGFSFKAYKSNIIPITSRSHISDCLPYKKRMMKNFITFCKQNQTPKKESKKGREIQFQTSFLYFFILSSFLFTKGRTILKNHKKSLLLSHLILSCIEFSLFSDYTLNFSLIFVKK